MLQGTYCSVFHAVLRVRASQARAAYVAAPGSHYALDALRRTAADVLQHRRQQAATDALRAGILLHEYGDQSTYDFYTCKSSGNKLQSSVTCSSSRAHQ